MATVLSGCLSLLKVFLTWKKQVWTHKLDTRDWGNQVFLLPFPIPNKCHFCNRSTVEKLEWFSKDSKEGASAMLNFDPVSRKCSYCIWWMDWWGFVYLGPVSGRVKRPSDPPYTRTSTSTFGRSRFLDHYKPWVNSFNTVFLWPRLTWYYKKHTM